MQQDASPLESLRREYRPRVPAALTAPVSELGFADTHPAASPADAATVAARFPRTAGRPVATLVRSGAGKPLVPRPVRAGVVLSGGPAPGGHNVIAGLLDALQDIHVHSTLVGFLGGPAGILRGRKIALDERVVAPFRNTGGFDLLGSGRDKIETDEQLKASAATCRELALDAVVVVGGDDSNTNAAVLAEHFLEHDVPTAVVGVPKTIDGDLKNRDIEASFGFDTATKVYAELIGNIGRDAPSSRKYWHFVKLMGRSASHVTLECALATRPNVALIAEEVLASGATLASIVDGIADAVAARAESGRPYGVVLVPEGLIEFVPEIRALIDDLNALLANRAGDPDARALVAEALPASSRAVFERLPEGFRGQLLLDRDAHGNVQVSKIETERLLIDLVAAELGRRRARGTFTGAFHAQHHFLGYEGRCAAPSNFDADYTYALGRLAALLALAGRTGYVATLRGLAGPAESWTAAGVPIASMFHVESRKGRPTPVIRKALVDLHGRPFLEFAANRARWAIEDAYRCPGPIQYFGPPEVADSRTVTLLLERGE